MIGYARAWDIGLTAAIGAVLITVSIGTSVLFGVLATEPFCYYPGCIEPVHTAGLALGLGGPVAILAAVAITMFHKYRVGKILFPIPLLGLAGSIFILGAAFVITIYGSRT